MNKKELLRETLLLTLGTALVAVGVYFFKFPNNFSTGGVTGIAVILSSLFPSLSSSAFASVINILFLILGFCVLNKGFGFRTVYCSILFSLLLSGLEWLVPLSAPLTDEKLLELFFAIIFPALGSAILFNLDGSTGGTDTAAIQMQRAGIATALFSIPNRYMHTPVEVCDLRDAYAASQLIAETILTFKGDEQFRPGID